MNVRSQVASIVAGTLLLWCAVGVVLVYNHRAELKNPALTPRIRQQHDHDLGGIAGVFIVFNGVMTILRIRQATRRKPVAVLEDRPKN